MARVFGLKAQREKSRFTALSSQGKKRGISTGSVADMEVSQVERIAPTTYGVWETSSETSLLEVAA